MQLSLPILFYCKSIFFTFLLKLEIISKAPFSVILFPPKLKVLIPLLVKPLLSADK
jgi:hypothetical protein